MRMQCTSAIIYVVLVGCGPGKPSMQGESSEGGESTADVSTTIAPTSSGAVPFFAEGEAPAGLEHVGFCSVP